MSDRSAAHPVVAVDGPTAAGKTTTSRLIASRLDLAYLESGRTYRLVAYMALQTGLDLYDEHGLIRLCDEILGNRVPGIELLMNDTGRVLRQLDVTHAVSLVARVPGLRSKLTSLTRSWAAGRGKSCIIEGRDIGTTVFPDAPVKFYLTAEPEVRALRRVKQEGGSYEVILKDVLRRDDADMTRQDSPLRPAEDAVLIDTTWLSINQVVEQMLSRCYEGDLAPPQPS